MIFYIRWSVEQVRHALKHAPKTSCRGLQINLMHAGSDYSTKTFITTFYISLYVGTTERFAGHSDVFKKLNYCSNITGC